MKKITSFLLALLVIISGLPISAFAEDLGVRFYAESVTVTQGGSFDITVKAENLVNVGGMELSAIYPDVFTLSSQNATGLTSSQSFDLGNDAENKSASFKMISLDGINGNGNVWRIRFTVSQDAAPGSYYIDLAVGELYDKNVQPIDATSSGIKVTVNSATPSVKTVYFQNSVTGSPHEGETAQVEFYVDNAQNLAAVEMEIEYDKTLVRLESATLGPKLLSAEGAEYNIKTDIPGYINVSYMCLGSVTGYTKPLLTLVFTAIANENTTTDVVLSVKELYDEDLADMNVYLYSPPSITLIKTEEEVRYPEIGLDSYSGYGESFTVDLTVPGETNLAAADFVVSYDSEYLTCTDVTGIEGLGSVVSNPNMANGSVKFSFMYNGGISADCTVAKLHFDVKKPGETNLSVTGTDLVNGNLAAVTVQYGTATVKHEELIITLPESFTVNIGETKTISAAILPESAADSKVTYSAEEGKTAIATVNSDTGEITGISLGTLVVTATGINGTSTDTCTVTVVCPGHEGDEDGTKNCQSQATCEICKEKYGELGEHTGGNATCTAKAKCEVCGKEYGEFAGHTLSAVAAVGEVHTENELKAGIGAHYKCSVCSKLFSDAEGKTETNIEALTGKVPEHIYTVQNNVDKAIKSEATCTADAAYYYSCSCGLVSNSTYYFVANTAKGHSPNEDDGDCTTAVHCSECGAVTTPAKGSHSGGNATCTAKAKCTVCGKEYGELAAHIPNEDDGDCTTAVHCSECNAVTTSAKDSHSGGTATCTAKAKCTVCGKEYGELAPHTLSPDDGDCTTAILCSKCNTAIVPAKDSHTGGNATCTAKAKCTVCGKEYGELAAHIPNEDDGDCTTAVHCSECNAVTTPAKDSHSGGTATCTAKAKCEVCGKEYGELAAHIPNEDDGDCTTAVHCSECGAVTTSAKDSHSGGNATCTAKAKCEVCGKEYGELAPHTLSPDDGDCTTAILCSKCNTAIVPAKDSHSGGTATCTAKAKCTVCGKEYGEFAGHTLSAVAAVGEVHTENELKAGIGAHYKCSVCSKLFSDAEGKTETNIEALTEEMPAHEFSIKDNSEKALKTPATFDKDAEYYYSCSCGKVSDSSFYTAENSALGATVIGNIESFGENCDITVELYKKGSVEPTYSTVISASDENKEYSFSGVKVGEYVLKVTKGGHAPRSLELNVASETVTQNTTVHLYGDLNGDGKTTLRDAMMVYDHCNNVSPLSEYLLLVADVDGSGTVNADDAKKICDYCNGIISEI